MKHPHAVVDGAAWWPEEADARTWSYWHAESSPQRRVVPFCGGFSIEATPYSRNMITEHGTPFEKQDDHED